VATAANAITSVANVQAAPGYNSGWTTAQIEAAIDRVSAFIEAYTGCSFINTTYTAEKYDGDGTRELLLDHYPISSVTSLTDTPTGEAATTVTVATELLIYSQEGRLKLKSDATSVAAFTADDQNISVTYVAGHGAAIANLPADIVAVATQMVVTSLSQNATGVTSEKIGDYSVTYDGKPVSDEAQGVLDIYKRNYLA